MANGKQTFVRYPVISHGAEYLVMGHLMRRNILTYKAPPNHEGYDLICLHPDPRKRTRPLRIQVKSRLASDGADGFPIKAKALDAFDFLIVAFMNVGFFGRRAVTHGCRAGAWEAEFFTLPPAFVREHHSVNGSWQKVYLRGLDLERYRNERGFEQIAKALRIPYPGKVFGMPPRGRGRPA